MKGYILGKLEAERYTDVIDFCKGRAYSEEGFEEELQEIAQEVTGVNLAACSWSTCVNELIKWNVIKQYRGEND